MFCLNHSDFVSVHQPTQYKRTVSDENNTIKHESRNPPLLNKKKPLNRHEGLDLPAIYNLFSLGDS